MALLPILTAPHDILARETRAVRNDELGDDLDTLMSDMAETMYAAPGVGLAAPQIGEGRRFVVVDSTQEDGSGLLKLVNPVITARSAETIPWKETCLSVPELEVEVDRHRDITVSWVTPHGEAREQDFHDFEAVIIQHELDHLMGTILLDKVSRFRRSRYLARLRKEARAGARP